MKRVVEVLTLRKGIIILSFILSIIFSSGCVEEMGYELKTVNKTETTTTKSSMTELICKDNVEYQMKIDADKFEDNVRSGKILVIEQFNDGTRAHTSLTEYPIDLDEVLYYTKYEPFCVAVVRWDYVNPSLSGEMKFKEYYCDSDGLLIEKPIKKT